ncbi:MAG: DUF87 domain-containing protein [Planctomycetes bacterium]|nr:DUF87 domain-containing protein [Planctomycetota bacterium]
MLLAVRTSSTNERGPIYMEQVLAAVHEANPQQISLSLEIGEYEGAVTLFVRFPPELRGIIEGQLYAQYPECQLEIVPERTVEALEGHRTWYASLALERDIFPIRRFVQFEDTVQRLTADPLSALLTTVALHRRKNMQAWMQLVLRPADDHDLHRAHRCLEHVISPFLHAHPRVAAFYLLMVRSSSMSRRLLGWCLGRLAGTGDPASLSALASSGRLHDREADAQAAADKLGRHLFEAAITLHVSAPIEACNVMEQKLREMGGAFGQFGSARLAAFRLGRIRRWSKNAKGPTFLLSTEEAATIWHPPLATVQTARMNVVEYRECEPPLALPVPAAHKHVALLGRTAFRGERRLFGILPDDRRRHMLILGKTGMGKSTLLHQLLTSDICAGRGVGLVDPHGDLCEAALASVPSNRTNDVILFDAGDSLHPLSFNPLDCPQAELRPLVASGVLSAFKKMYGHSWGRSRPISAQHIRPRASRTVAE